MKFVEYRIDKKWVLESGIQLKESGIPFTIGIQYQESGIDSLDPKSKTVLDSITWGKKLTSWVFLILC